MAAGEHGGGNGIGWPLTEHSIALKLEELRAQQQGHEGPSFPTIAVQQRGCTVCARIAAYSVTTFPSLCLHELPQLQAMTLSLQAMTLDGMEGYGANGAVIHYQAEESTALPIGTDSLLLLDSGAQYSSIATSITADTATAATGGSATFVTNDARACTSIGAAAAVAVQQCHCSFVAVVWHNAALLEPCTSLEHCKDAAFIHLYRAIDGTTDVTRTLHFGTPTAHQKHCFTLVLKGHINLATAVFPEGLLGSKLDVLARTPLWTAGLDYRHGTGHGVGAFLNVHEGPHGIHYRIRPDEAGILSDMTTSIEPGYYEDGSFGVRIENICIVVPAQTAHTFGGKRSLTFETVTMAPLQRKLIDTALLTPQELAWVNAYSADVRAKLGPLMKPINSDSSSSSSDAYAYLLRETEPISA
eukprot:21131-Heterococcus_DN1.PRE.3